MMKSKTITILWKPLLISLLISLGIGGLSGFLTKDNTGVFQTLKRPSLSPPAILFPIVWTALFTLMGISAYLIFISENPAKKSSLLIYAIQLAVNFFWSLIFFNLNNYLFALVWLLLLWILVLLMILDFYKINKTAARLQIPYFIWITFAAYLNWGIWLLNR